MRSTLLRRTAVVLALTAGAVAPALAAPAQAEAAPLCSLSVPTKVSITAPTTTVVTRLGDNCATADVVLAAWNGHHSAGRLADVVPLAFTDVISRDDWTIRDDRVALGTYTWRAAGAKAGHLPGLLTGVDQNQPTTTVKLGSRLVNLSALLVDKKLTLSVKGERYDTGRNVFSGYSGGYVTLQYRVKGTTEWRYLRRLSLNASGFGSTAISYPGKREYRAVLAPTDTVWGATSTTLYR